MKDGYDLTDEVMDNPENRNELCSRVVWKII
jgi:hypothetical protein